MATLTFPSDPQDGMIFEAAPGLFFQYNAGSNCWVRIDGVESLGLATPITDGLMAPEDLQKLNDLLIPPPQSTLKGEDCGIVFNQGKIRLTSTDKSVDIDHALEVLTKIDGVTISDELPWKIHQNTAGYNFNLNLLQFIERLEEESGLTKIQLKGKDGRKGAQGEDGIDMLDTGPVGEPGEDGAPSIFGGTLLPEVLDVDVPNDLKNRAIVDVQTEESDDGNFLVITRANIGDPSSCIELLDAQPFISPWLLVIDENEPTLVRKLAQLDDCTLPCVICNTSLHHLYIQPLINAINNRYVELAIKLRKEKERLFVVWMNALISLFNEQKASLCCALENCTTRKRNTEDRRYIERQRIQASHSNHNLIIDGDEDRVTVDMNVGRDCPGPEPPDCEIINDCDQVTNPDGGQLERIAGDGDTPWIYRSYQSGAPADYFQPGFSEAGFSVGVSPFGSVNFGGRVSQIRASPFTPGGPIRSSFVYTADLVIRYRFTLSGIDDDVRMILNWSHVDDSMHLFLNGQAVMQQAQEIFPNGGNVDFTQGAGGAANYVEGRGAVSHTESIPSGLFVSGENLLVIRARDTLGQHAILEGLTLQIAGPQKSCTMAVRSDTFQKIVLSKSIGDPTSFELASPGDGLFLTDEIEKLTVSVKSTQEDIDFKLALRDTDGLTYIWPAQGNTVLDEYETLEFPLSDMSGITAGGRGTLVKPSTSIAINQLLIELNNQSDVEPTIFFDTIDIHQVDGTITSLAAFGWADTLALKQAWNTECRADPIGALCDNGIVSITLDPRFHTSSDRGIKLNIPKGNYKAVVAGCCAEVAPGAFSGRFGISSSPGESPIETTAPNLGVGTFAQAQDKYLGLAVPFTHEGGEITTWVIDANAVATDNAGSITLDIFPTLCDELVDPTAGGEDSILVYANTIAAANLIGFITAFGGTLPAIDNYNREGGSDDAGPSIMEGPEAANGESHIWFYNSVDGLSAFIVNGGPDSNSAAMDFRTVGNNAAQSLIVADDPGEVSTELATVSESAFKAEWEYGPDGDGAVVGYFEEQNWVFEVSPLNLGNASRLVAKSSNGTDVELAISTDGLGTTLAADKILFTRIANGCLMHYKQVEWLERGHRTGASCSAVVTVEGVTYIVVKRSIGIDKTCGGGETLSNQCVSTFLATGAGHPAIAWPTFNKREFLGLPTSGFQGFVEDEDLSSQILAKLQTGDFEEPVNGDPVSNIPFVIFPSGL